MTPEVFSTQPLAPRDRPDAWHEWFRPVLDVTPLPYVGDEFLAENRVWKLGGLVMSHVSAPPVRVLRTKAHVRRDPIDHWVLTYAHQGTMTVKAEAASFEVPAGVPYLWSLAEESESERTRVDRIQLFLPRDGFRDIALLLDAARGAVLDMPLGHLLGDYMLALERRLPALTPAELPALTNAVRAMIAAAVAPTAARVAVARNQIELGRMERVRKAVQRHLRSPILGPATLCRLIGVSRSNLYRLLEPVGGVAHYIQKQRLFEAHSILSNPALNTKISMLADDLCFSDASSFSRAFKKEFGCSPSDARVAALAGFAIPAIPLDGGARDVADFSDLLRDF
ncbi:MAG TPA: helix-turn-helix domain-containing protein [Acetobacteraceae bacterium]|nr:helix-turn-helix domain-containing protein [Acetobacteraceae bacterium]